MMIVISDVIVKKTIIEVANEEKKIFGIATYSYTCTPSTDEFLTFCLPEKLCTRSVFTTNQTKGYCCHFSTCHIATCKFYLLN